MTKTNHPERPEQQITLDDAAPVPARDSHTDSWRFKAEEDGETAQEDAQSDALIGTLVAERYLVKGLLGRGGMGAVYHAEHTQLKKQVALKVLHGYMSSNEEVVARFEREAVAAGRLDHPSIVAATDFGRLEDGSFYLALEYVDGESLAETLNREGALGPRRAVSIACQMTDALCTAHAGGIVHRDLKPDNVLLVRTEDKEDFVKVVDFGIAKMRLDEDHQEGLTRAGLVFGTPEYMSPEQAMGHEADARSDLYGVGMLLYEMLAGRSPFHADDVTAMLTAQITEPPPPLPSQTPEALRALVMRLLEKDPEERPESAQELAAELSIIGRALGYDAPPPRTSAGARLDVSRNVALLDRPSFGGSIRSLSMRPVTVGKKHIPLWIPLLGLGVGIAVGVAAMLMNTEVVPTKEMKRETEIIDAEAQLIVEATGGDRDAIAELRKLTMGKQSELKKAGLIAEKDGAAPRAPSAEEDEALSRQANRFLVLGHGYSIIKHYPAAVEMYREAVHLDPHVAEEPELLIDVRVAIAARDAVDEGLDLALHDLGSHGADLIYDVYLDHLGQAGMTPVVARAMKLAQSDELLAHATPALKVALRLQAAKYCAEYREIIPDALLHADDRSLAKLRALRARRGCGTFGNKDCFVCLRKDDVDLDGAVARAESHPSPSFLTPEEVKPAEPK